MINHIQNKSYLHNICVYCVYLYKYTNSIYFEKIDIYIYITNKYLIYNHNIFLNIYMCVCVYL